MEKISYNPYEVQTNKDIRKLQIVFLYHIEKLKPKAIQKYVQLSTSTISNYAKKFADLVEIAKDFFNGIVDRIKDFIKKDNYNIEVAEDVEIKKNIPCAYIIEYYNKNNELLFLKIGKAKDIMTRVKQYLKENKYKAKKAIIKKLYYIDIPAIEDCEEDFALSMENALRGYYKKNYKKAYIPQDRFMNISFNKDKINNSRILNKSYKDILDTAKMLVEGE